MAKFKPREEVPAFTATGYDSSTGDLVELLPTIGRTGVLRHIGILVGADLIRVRPDGRKRWNYLNPDPIKLVCTSWVARHIDGVSSSVARLKTLAESEPDSKRKT